jgi:hypothetical protein
VKSLWITPGARRTIAKWIDGCIPQRVSWESGAIPVADGQVLRCRPGKISAVLAAPIWFIMGGGVGILICITVDTPALRDLSFWVGGVVGVALLVLLYRMISAQRSWQFDGEQLSSPSLPAPLRLVDVTALQAGLHPNEAGVLERKSVAPLLETCLILFLKDGTCLPLQVMLVPGGPELMKAVHDRCAHLRDDSLAWDTEAIRDRVGAFRWNAICRVAEVSGRATGSRPPS